MLSVLFNNAEKSPLLETGNIDIHSTQAQHTDLMHTTDRQHRQTTHNQQKTHLQNGEFYLSMLLVKLFQY